MYTSTYRYIYIYEYYVDMNTEKKVEKPKPESFTPFSLFFYPSPKQKKKHVFWYIAFNFMTIFVSSLPEIPNSCGADGCSAMASCRARLMHCSRSDSLAVGNACLYKYHKYDVTTNIGKYMIYKYIHVFLVCFLIGFLVYVCVCVFLHFFIPLTTCTYHIHNHIYIHVPYIVSLVDPCMHSPSQIQQRMQIQQSVNNLQIQIKNNPDSPTQRNPLNRNTKILQANMALGPSPMFFGDAKVLRFLPPVQLPLGHGDPHLDLHGRPQNKGGIFSPLNGCFLK